MTEKQKVTGPASYFPSIENRAKSGNG